MKDLIEKIEQTFARFKEDANKQAVKDNKTAGVRARKTSLELDKLLKEYRKVSIESAK